MIEPDKPWSHSDKIIIGRNVKCDYCGTVYAAVSTYNKLFVCNECMAVKGSEWALDYARAYESLRP